jgi:hypothetical protein
MAKFIFVVYSKPSEGREIEYNDWYSKKHLADLLAIPGVISARRFKYSATQLPNTAAPTQPYLAIYEVDGPDIDAFQREMAKRGADGRMPISATLSKEGLSASFWEVL